MLTISSLLLALPLLASSVSTNAVAEATEISVRTNKPSTPKVALAWYGGWHAEDYPLSKVSWKKYTHMTYAFAETTPDVHNLSLANSDQELLPQFVKTAKKNGVKSLVSIGGWTGSRWFSTDVGNAKNRTAFVKTVVDFATKYKLDGLDFDWEYPGNQGLGCNTISPDDVSHYVSFLKELRKDPRGKKLYLTAASSLFPWIDETGESSKDVSAFAKLLDHIAIMNYDIWGSWTPTVGPNGPLNDTCAPEASQGGSAVSGVAAWRAAGIPASQLVLGVPAYGHSWTVNASEAYETVKINGKKTKTLKLFANVDAEKAPSGDSWDDGAGVDACGAETGPGGSWTIWGMVKAGFLTKKGVPAKGIESRFDTCSQTPLVYNKTSQIMVAYDDARSFAAKGKFIKNLGLRGFATWEAGGDYDDILLDSIRKAAGFKSKA